MNPPPGRLTARAKLTRSFRVVGRRGDGYHLLEAEMVTLAFHDDVTISDGEGLRVSGPAADGVPTDDTNLVRRALVALGRRALVHVDKHIPAGAGLGGGSADAAAVLRWAGNDDLDLAASLGADVPFCLVGGRALVRGIGEEVEPLPWEDRDITLVIPPRPVSTVAVYRAWDDLGGPRSEGLNDLEPAALAVAPDLARWRDRIREAAGRAPVLAGSGSTWFVEGAVDGLENALQPATVVVTRTDRP